MPHKLRLLVKIDRNPSTAALVVRGCLTDDNCRALLPVIRRITALADGMAVTVDLGTARHIEASAVRIVEQAGTVEFFGDLGEGKVLLSLPAVLPSCRP